MNLHHELRYAYRKYLEAIKHGPVYMTVQNEQRHTFTISTYCKLAYKYYKPSGNTLASDASGPRVQLSSLRQATILLGSVKCLVTSKQLMMLLKITKHCNTLATYPVYRPLQDLQALIY